MPDWPKIQSDIACLSQWAEQHGVSIQVETDQNLFVSDIGRERSDPASKGNGALVLRRLFDIASQLPHTEPIPDLT